MATKRCTRTRSDDGIRREAAGPPHWTTVSGRFVVGDTTISGAYGVTDTFVYINHGWASDGTSFKFHDVAHVTFNASGVVVEWDKASLTCG